jgi:hypothetical protein
MPIQPTLERAPAATPPAGYCGACGYDLRGLERRGDCPECGGWYAIDEAPAAGRARRALRAALRLLWPVPFIAAGVLAFWLDPNGRARPPACARSRGS